MSFIDNFYEFTEVIYTKVYDFYNCCCLEDD